MSRLRYLLDEHVDPDVRTQLMRHEPNLVVWLIGDPGAPKRGTADPVILLWCEDYSFSLVTNNRASMPIHAQAHLTLGHHVPGVFVLGPSMNLGAIIEELRLIWAASEAEEYTDLFLYLPLTS